MTNPVLTTARDLARRPRPRAGLRAGALVAVAATLLASFVLSVIASDAHAANSATDVGRNLGSLLKSWATWLFGGATAIIAVTHLGRRDVAGALVFAGMAILVGGFVLAGPQVADFIEGIYKFADTGR